MSLFDEHNEAEVTVECARKAIEHVYEEADKQYSIIYNQLRELLNRGSRDRFYKAASVRQLPRNYKTLMDDITKLKQDAIEDRKIISNLQIDGLILKYCIIRFMKQHPTWKLEDDERKLIFG